MLVHCDALWNVAEAEAFFSIYPRKINASER